MYWEMVVCLKMVGGWNFYVLLMCDFFDFFVVFLLILVLFGLVG